MGYEATILALYCVAGLLVYLPTILPQQFVIIIAFIMVLFRLFLNPSIHYCSNKCQIPKHPVLIEK
jgi:hypothetical protein